MIRIRVKKQLQPGNEPLALNIDTTIEGGHLVAVNGPSGAGKTTLLRILAGFLHPDEGTIVVNDEVWFDSEQQINLPPQHRKVGMVFQDYALFPNMNVRENLTYALQKGQNQQRVDELIEIMELQPLDERLPGTLSGGQQQRVAVARALVRQPEILLLDEPLSALDREMRARLQQYLLKAHRQYNLATLLVTHDLSEILRLADHLIIIESGRIKDQGPPEKILTQKEVSGKFQFTGEVMGLEKQDFIYIVSVLIGNELVKVVADESEGANLSIGDTVLVASKAFNPLIRKLS